MIIGITGTLGAGKGTVMEHLVSRYRFAHFSARQFIADEVRRRGLPVNRDTLADVANDLRATRGQGHIIRELYGLAKAAGRHAVFESVRTPGEVGWLKRQGDFRLFAVDADPRIRYERIRARGSDTDHVTFEEFLEDEAREMHSDDPTHQNIAACMRQADHTFLNNGTVDELHRQVDAVMAQLNIA
jgi:dephospho-CoA kinase